MATSRLSRGAIIDAAFDLLAEGGLDAITARALASRLGVRAGALYYHLPDMSALRDEMGTRISARMLESVARTTGTEWRAVVRSMAERARAVVLDYRDGARLVSGTVLTDDDALRLLEVPLASLVSAGFSPLDAQRALTTLNAYVVGFTIEQQQRRDGALHYTAEERRARLDPTEQPLSYHLSSEVVDLPDDAFTWGLDALIHGIGVRAGM